MKMYKIGIVGATGLVGRTLLEVLEERSILIDELRLFASKKSEGKIIKFKDKKYRVQILKENCFKDLDFVLFTCGANISSLWAKEALNSGAYVIDNSSFFRMNDNVSLIVPEINHNDYQGKSKLIANPNCSTIQSVLALKPLDDLYGLTKVIYTTFQAVSGAGQRGIDDLKNHKKTWKNRYFPYDIHHSLIPSIDKISEDNFTKEEIKMIKETKKILHKDNINIVSTCVRVPIERTHAVSIYCEFENDINLFEAITTLSHFPGIKVLDDLESQVYPVGEIAKNSDFVFVGRIRKVPFSKNGLLLYVVSDNLRKGAALNMVQILEKLIKS